jgi:tight adherence protein C
MGMELVVVGAMLVAAAGLCVYALYPSKREDKEIVKRRLAGQRAVDEVAELRTAARQKAREDIVKKAAPVLQRLVMPTSDEESNSLKQQLATAGYRSPQAQTIFLASKTLLALLGLGIGTLISFSMAQPLMIRIAAIAFCGGVGFMLPVMWLSMAMNARKEKIRNGLPDTLDLLVVSVESGLALDGALKRVGDEMAAVHTDLSDEMRIATVEAQMGIPRGEALTNMAKRTGVDEVRSLVSVIVQAEKFGTSVARALRNQADTLRTKRSMAAEERAQKTAVKLMIPLVLFIFPAMGVVLGGPAILKMIEALKDNPALG